MGLWMVRAFPGNTDRMKEFLENNIIAVHWGIGDLTGCNTKEAIANIVSLANLQPRDASLKIGLLDRFVNKMKATHYVIVPYNDVFYSAIITSDYYFDSDSEKFEHQRTVKWLFGAEPFDRKELPEALQASLKTQLGLADISQHEASFVNYINKKMGIDSLDIEETKSVENELSLLVIDAMEVIKAEIKSDDPDRRLKAAIAVMEINSRSSFL